MAVEWFMDGFDHWIQNAANYPGGYKWTYIGPNGGTDSGVYRTGRYSFALGNTNSVLFKRVSQTYKSVLFGVAYLYTDGNWLPLTGSVLFHVYGPGDIYQLIFEIAANRCITVKRGDGTVLGTTSLPMYTGLYVWKHIEVEAVAGDSDGYVRIKIDQVEALTLTGIDTQNGDTGFQGLALRNAGTDYNSCKVDDFFSRWDTEDSRGNFKGACRILTALPNADGSLVQMSPSSGANYSCMNNYDNPLGAYVDESVPGERDLYGFEDFGAILSTEQVLCVQATTHAKRLIAGVPSTFRQLCRPGSTDHEGPVHTLTDNATQFVNAWDINPDTGLPWTIAQINAAQFGNKCESVA